MATVVSISCITSCRRNITLCVLCVHERSILITIRSNSILSRNAMYQSGCFCVCFGNSCSLVTFCLQIYRRLTGTETGRWSSWRSCCPTCCCPTRNLHSQLTGTPPARNCGLSSRRLSSRARETKCSSIPGTLLDAQKSCFGPSVNQFFHEFLL